MQLRRILLLLIVPLLVAVAFLEQPAANVTGASVPANFTDTTLFNVSSPTALAFTPDGRLLVNTQPGVMRIYQNGALLPTPAMTIPAGKICSNSERGLLGVAVDPDFATNHFIYVYYTFQKNGNCNITYDNGPVNRVSRFILGDDNLVAVDWNTTPTTGETVLLDNIASYGNHNGGDLHFGQDNLLYISVGDGGCSITNGSNCQGNNDNARRLDILYGKILRINKDGSVPTSNPRFNDSGSRRCGDPAGAPGGTGPCQEMFAWGLRNPFRFTFQPGTNQFYINDVGDVTWEEIDVSQANADYGWNVREGFCPRASTTNCGAPPAGMTNPIFAYQHGTCNSITGGAFAPTGVWPAPYDGAYFFADYVCGKIFRLTGTPGNYTAQDFVTGMGGGSAVTLLFGPYKGTQALYYTTYAGGGSVNVLSFNRAPTAAISANPTSGLAPLTVNFNGSGSTDPDGNNTIANYIWNFGDGSPILTTTTATTSHSYAAGTYTASLVVQDNLGLSSNTATVSIAVNSPPTPVIDSPVQGTTFAVGESISLTGHASDQQDGPLPQSSLAWYVVLHDGVNAYPFLGPVYGNNSFTAPAPPNLPAAANGYLEIQLKATDSDGASTVVTQALQPKKVNVTFHSVNPTTGVSVNVNSTSLTTPVTVVSWQNYVLNVTVPHQTISAQAKVFSVWSDANPNPNPNSAFRQITTPASAATYEATMITNPGCNATSVTIFNQDDVTVCGTLRYAVANAPDGSTLDLSAATTISLTNTLNVSRNLTLQGKANCTVGNGVTITATGAALNTTSIDGLILSGGVHLKGVTVKQFGGKQLVLSGGTGTGSNKLECTIVSKT